ncbi:hypothetical protein AF70_00040240 [Pseudomonas sp. KD5]|nr:hypothetical protein [Pseudomonas sp. KD5]
MSCGSGTVFATLYIRPLSLWSTCLRRACFRLATSRIDTGTISARLAGLRSRGPCTRSISARHRVDHINRIQLQLASKRRYIQVTICRPHKRHCSRSSSTFNVNKTRLNISNNFLNDEDSCKQGNYRKYIILSIKIKSEQPNIFCSVKITPQSRYTKPLRNLQVIFVSPKHEFRSLPKCSFLAYRKQIKLLL